MSESSAIAKKGTILLFDEGSEIDGVDVIAICTVLKDFAPEEVLREFLETYPFENQPLHSKSELFVTYLITGSYVRKEKHDRYYLGEFNDLVDAEYHPWQEDANE